MMPLWVALKQAMSAYLHHESWRMVTDKAGVETAQFVHLSFQLQWKKPLSPPNLAQVLPRPFHSSKGDSPFSLRIHSELEILLKTLLYSLNQTLCEINHLLLKDMFLHAL